MKTLVDFMLSGISNTKIFEMAYNRSKYIDKVLSLNKQIVENWCLIKYCNLYDVENYNRLHWCKELISHLTNLNGDVLKNGDKKRATKEAFETDELYDENQIYIICEPKWDDENLPIDKLSIISESFVKDINILLELISNKSNYQKIKNYVYNEI